MSADDAAPLASLPSLDRLLRAPELAPLLERHGRTRTTGLLRTRLQALRDAVVAGTVAGPALATAIDPRAIATALDVAIHGEDAMRLRAVFNLTGTVLHTNLGRAPLPEAAIRAVAEAMRSPVDLEFDLASGRRGAREARVAGLLRELTGAQAATVVNNNAAAVLLLLNTLASRRDVVVSRGELVEIGGSFRIPDVMRAAGARLVEVGTTNRTHAGDYRDAIGARTALLMQVHASNYAISGFTARVEAPELAMIARDAGLPVAVDLGSGALIDLGQWGLPAEPTVRATLEAGADLVAFSGDKLLGGPQAGLIVGRADLIARIDRNPLKRALRMDKMGLAALEAVLGLYREPEWLPQRLPALRLLLRDETDIAAQAQRLLPAVQEALGDDVLVEVARMQCQVGSGAQPTASLPSAGLRIGRSGRGKAGPDRLARRLRALPRPVLGSIADDALWLDLRCLEAADEPAFLAQLAALPR